MKEWEEAEQWIARVTGGRLMHRKTPYDVLTPSNVRLQVKGPASIQRKEEHHSGQFAFNFHLPLKGGWDFAILIGKVHDTMRPSKWERSVYFFVVPRGVIEDHFNSHSGSILAVSHVSRKWSKFLVDEEIISERKYWDKKSP